MSKVLKGEDGYVVRYEERETISAEKCVTHTEDVVSQAQRAGRQQIPVVVDKGILGGLT